MNVSHAITSKNNYLNTPVLYLIAIVLGILAGLSDVGWLQNGGHFIAEVFIRMFKCISLPIISLSIIVTLSNYQTSDNMRSVWRRTMTYTLSTTLIAAIISMFLYLLIHPSMATSAGQPLTTVLPTTQETGYLSHLMNLIPTSIIAPFLSDDQVITVLFIGIVIGLAIRYIPDQDAQDTIRQFFKGSHGLFMVIIRWVVAIIPIGLFGFISTTVVQLRGGMQLKGIGEYLLIIVLANLIQGLIVLPLWLRSQGIKPFATLKSMLPALSLAFFSKSSVGSLAVTMNTAEKNLNIDPKISRSVFPLCTSINMNGCAAFIFTTVIYLMQNGGVHITIPMMMMWTVIATVAAIGNAGVPMGCFFISASLLASMNMPIYLLGIILPFYSLIDMLETALNVWSDSCVVRVVDEKNKQHAIDTPDYASSDSQIA